jgi:hypothetical protein
MTSFPTIEKFKEEINKFEPSSVIYYARKSTYNDRLCFTRMHGIRYTGEENMYSKMLSSLIQETEDESNVPHINVEATLKRAYTSSVSNIGYALRYKMNKRMLRTHEEMIGWLQRKEKTFSSGYSYNILKWREDNSINSLLKVGLWLSDKETCIPVRDQVIELVKLLMIKEKENGCGT